MSLDCVRECADMARTSECVQQYRTTQLTIRVVRWTGGELGLGSKEVVSELVMPKYEVRDLGPREVLASGGHLRLGDVRVKDISPPYQKSDGSGQGGYTKEQLAPALGWTLPDYNEPQRARVVEYVLTGDVDGVYAYIDLSTEDPTSWSLLLRNTRESP